MCKDGCKKKGCNSQCDKNNWEEKLTEQIRLHKKPRAINIANNDIYDKHNELMEQNNKELMKSTS